MKYAVRFIFLPDSPVTAKGLTLREKRIAVERLRGNQTGVENKVSSVSTDTVAALQMVPSPRDIHRHQNVPLLHPWLRVQCTQWWDIQLRYLDY